MNSKDCLKMHANDFYRRLAGEWEREMQLALAGDNQAAYEHAKRERDNYVQMFQAACGAEQ